MILVDGDFNTRTATLSDFIEDEKEPNLTLNHIVRRKIIINQDKIVNKFGEELRD